MLQDLFIREHNAIAAVVAEGEPNLDDEGIFQKTRLTMAALVAKIHTVDWTPTLLNNPTMRSAMHINWGGVMGLGPKLLGIVGAFSGQSVNVSECTQTPDTCTMLLCNHTVDVFPPQLH